MLTKDQIITLYETGMAILNGVDGMPDREALAKATIAFEKAGTQSPVAKAKHSMLLALGAGCDQDDAKAADTFVDAAISGHPALLRDLGVLLLIEARSSSEEEKLGGGLLVRAAARGDWVAVFVILREAVRGRYFATVADLMSLANSLSDAVPFSVQLRNQMASLPTTITQIENTTFNETLCREAVHRSLMKSPIDLSHHLARTPDIRKFDGILSPLECDYLIAVSSGLMQPSKVVNSTKANAIQAQYRTSDGATLLPGSLDFPLIGIIRALSAHRRYSTRTRRIFVPSQIPARARV